MHKGNNITPFRKKGIPIEQKVQVVVDTTSYLTREYAEEHNVNVVPLSYQFEGSLHQEGAPGSFDGFFTRLKNGKDFPRTSQPPVTAFSEVYEAALQGGKEVIAILISSLVSGTYQSASIAADSLSTDKDKVHVIDSKSGAAGVYFLVEKVREYCAASLPVARIVENIRKDITRLRFIIAVPNLEYLARGGRLSTAAAILGNVLHLCPVIGMLNGKLEVLERARGFERAVKKMITHLPEKVEKLAICHAMAPELAAELRDRLAPSYPNNAIELREIGPVMGAHFGPGAIGICCLSE